MDYFTIGAIIWVGIFLLLGILKGFWKSVAAAASLFLGYFASVYFGAWTADYFVEQFASLKIGRSVWWVMGATLIFIVVSLVVRLLILAVGKSLPIGSRLFDRLGGGVISVGYGAVLGAVLLWGAAFLADSWNLRQERAGGENAARIDTSSPAVTWSRRLMAYWVNWNVKQSGGSETLAGISRAVAESPARVMAEVQSTVRSSEFKQLIQSEHVQELVAQQDSAALQCSPEFQQLLQQPAVQELRKVIAPDSAGWSEEKIAQEAVDIWNRVEQLKSHPQVAQLLNDTELQAFMQGSGNITPSLLSKGQELFSLLGRDTALIQELNAQRLYQWRDAEGDVHVTGEQDVPEDRKASAEPLDF